MNLFDFGLTYSEPDLWNIIPDMTLRIYDREQSYFATWDIGCPTSSLAGWPKPPNPDFHWKFENKFVDVDGIAMLKVKECQL